jgi:hypothetical protein
MEMQEYMTEVKIKQLQLQLWVFDRMSSADVVYQYVLVPVPVRLHFATQFCHARDIWPWMKCYPLSLQNNDIMIKKYDF